MTLIHFLTFRVSLAVVVLDFISVQWQWSLSLIDTFRSSGFDFALFSFHRLNCQLREQVVCHSAPSCWMTCWEINPKEFLLHFQLRLPQCACLVFLFPVTRTFDKFIVKILLVRSVFENHSPICNYHSTCHLEAFRGAFGVGKRRGAWDIHPQTMLKYLEAVCINVFTFKLEVGFEAKLYQLAYTPRLTFLVPLTFL